MKPYHLVVPMILAVGTASAAPKPYTPPAKRIVAPSEPALKVETLTPSARVEAANRAAMREPATENYLNAIQTYAYIVGALYRVYAAPERVTDLMLEAGEILLAISAGDTARWIIGDTKSGEGEAAHTHILIKPHASGLKTNLIVTTNRRAYHLQLESTPSTYMAAVAWRYPQLPVVPVATSRSEGPSNPGIAEGIPLDRLRFTYEITGDRPAWRPLRAFDDGTHVYIAFPPALMTSEAPPLFVIGANGQAQLVTYRQTSGYYIVDRLFEVAELRLGTAPQTVVRIRRTDITILATAKKKRAHRD